MIYLEMVSRVAQQTKSLVEGGWDDTTAALIAGLASISYEMSTAGVDRSDVHDLISVVNGCETALYKIADKA